MALPDSVLRLGCSAGCRDFRVVVAVSLQADWERRVKQTEDLLRQREAELQAKGVRVGGRDALLEKGKHTPHMVNLHEDPACSEQIFFFFEPGAALGGLVAVVMPVAILANCSAWVQAICCELAETMRRCHSRLA